MAQAAPYVVFMTFLPFVFWAGMIALFLFLLYQIIWRAVCRGIRAAREDDQSRRY